MYFVASDARETTINSAKEMRLRDSRRINKKIEMEMTFLSTVSNTRETLEVPNWTLRRKEQNRMRIKEKTKE